MEERSRSELLQRNEQVKALQSLSATFGFALVASGAGRWFLQGIDENAMLCLFVGCGIIGAGVKLLILLEAEM